MSRIGKKPVLLGESVTATIVDNKITLKGPKGELSLDMHPLTSAVVTDGQVVVSKKNDTKLANAIHGLTRSLIANMANGVKNGYEKKLEMVGTGYRVVKKGSGLQLSLGFSHTIDFPAIEGINLEVEGNTIIFVKGIDKQLVGQIAANIRALRPPEPYKGKGVRYSGEHVRRKAGKQAKAGATGAGK
ncbi:50S ribosomal protein L6 [Candidatus Collierbacteria bacterium]|nr:50S ribosomal protein L6 [Candidatus Collierbacteria bacterium]